MAGPKTRERALISDICEINRETYSPKRHDWKTIRYLDTGNITRNVIDSIEELSVGEDEIPSRARRVVSPGDIVYSMVRPNQRHYGIIDGNQKNMLVSTGFATISVNPDVADRDYVYYCLTTDNVVDHLQSIAEQSVSVYPAINPEDLGDISIPLPPIEDQKKISGILSALDNKIRVNNAINDYLSEA
jgi:type I restriction enzyme S subunit